MGLIGVVMACDVRFWCWDCAMIVADCVLDSILRATPPPIMLRKSSSDMCDDCESKKLDSDFLNRE